MSADYMFIMKSSEDRSFSDGGLQRFGKIKLNPAACVLNYGQGIIEELKAYRKPENSILLFRPEEHGLRMRVGAERLLMPAPTVEQFVEAVKVTVLENRRWVPSPNKGFLHIRPLLIGSGPVLSLTPAPEFIFLILVTPMGDYSRGGLEPINLVVENEIHHAFHGGAGSVKLCCCNFHLPLIHIALSGCLSIGLPVGALWSFWHSHCLAIHKEASADCWKMATTNHPGSYHFILKAHVEAKENGFSDVLFLDSVHQRYVEETSTANIFLVKDTIISTPALEEGTVLPGVTRKCVTEIACSQGYQVEERLVSVEELFEADEVFCTGNAVHLSRVGSITYLGKKVSCCRVSATAPGAVKYTNGSYRRQVVLDSNLEVGRIDHGC
ncbi:branched-chain-amino-acid aminotransferase 5, chloroplastic [Prunus persica]|uniref:branched-chain-amino-acid aminotransferase 5, chloroplastic n=1 Tax=Prunus persica TaxID=3760 RepID=UPI0009AB8EE1|nr:branched-chain-amino-acid aminotransferase 5, chloroplastic [Prunus persica]